MIYIKEDNRGNNSVDIRVDGILDGESIDILKEVCERHLADGKKVLLNLKGLIHINREGREFLHEIQKGVTIVENSEFMQVCLE